MQVTREGDYGLRAMIYLASHEGEVVSAAAISREQGIPLKFLARIMPKLVRQGLVVSLPGSKGGYRLGRTAARITFLQVLEAIEGPLLLNECLDEKSDCVHETCCSMKSIWCEGQRRLGDYFGSITFDQLRETTHGSQLISA